MSAAWTPPRASRPLRNSPALFVEGAELPLARPPGLVFPLDLRNIDRLFLSFRSRCVAWLFSACLRTGLAAGGTIVFACQTDYVLHQTVGVHNQRHRSIAE